ncbi:hypothetical protein Tco_0892852 [Tanacetum coccineum]|uniref:Uncharacterized protein n=1 Tax=Tanacetum coccineum TaxID=301880 RepID=A0ABQ5C737_9ASTR
MGEPLSPDRVFDFPMDEPHPAYDYFAPALLPRELEAMVDEQMVVPAVDEIAEQMDVHAFKEVAEPVVKAEEEQVIALLVDVVEGQMDALMMDMEEDLAVLFSDDDFGDDASYGLGEEESWEVNEDWLMAPTKPPPVLAVLPPSIYEVGGPSTAVAEGPSFPQVAPGLPVPPCMIEDLSTRLDNLEYGHGQLVQRVIQGSDAEIAAGVIIGEIGPRVLAVEGQMQVMASQMIQAVDRVEQVGVQVELGQQTSTQRDETVTGLTQQVQALQADVQQRDTQIQQLQTTVTEMSSRESMLMRCILGLEKRIAALERRPPGP